MSRDYRGFWDIARTVGGFLLFMLAIVAVGTCVGIAIGTRMITW